MTQGVTGPHIDPPRDEEDIERFLNEVREHPDYREIEKRLLALGQSCPNGDVRYWSVRRYKSRGKWKTVRLLLHENMVRKALARKRKAPEGTKPIAILLIGTPGSGKTSAGMRHIHSEFKLDFVVINADDIKEQLPEYMGWNAGALHEESSYVAEKLIYSEAVDGRHHIVFDLTGTDEMKMLGMVDGLDSMGYEVHVTLVKLPAWMAAGRVWDRFRKETFYKDPNLPSGRFVPPEYVYNDVDDKPAKTYEILKEHPAVKSWTSLSTEQKTVQVLEKGKR